MRASGEAQGLAYIAKHLGLDPYEVWNSGKAHPLPPHPRPKVYRYLLMGMAYYLEDHDRAKFKMVSEAQGAKVELVSMLEQFGTSKG